MKNKILKLVNMLMILALVMTVFMPIVNAAPDLSKTEGSLKITKYEIGDKGQQLLAGVTFDIYKVGDDQTSTELPTDSAILATKQSKTTGTDGVVTFTSLALGRYLVVESDAPANVVSKIANFLVDVPMTSADGTGLVYDVEVSPKNNTVYGGVTLTKADYLASEAMAGVKFELQKLNGQTWSKYGEELTTANGTTDADDAGTILEKGTIVVTGLPAGSYRFVETATLQDYILNNQATYNFEVSMANDGKTVVEPSQINVFNMKPTLDKKITTDLTEGSAKIGDTVSYKITTPIPTVVENLPTYKMHETIEKGLTYTDGTVVVKAVGADNETTLEEGTDYTLTVADDKATFEIVFTEAGKTKLAAKDNLEVVYDAVLNENADSLNLGNKTTTKLTYSTIVDKNYEGTENETTSATKELTADVPVYTGGLYIKKVDASNNIIPTGATFKIATSEENAKNGVFIDGIELTTDANGLASYKGLTYGKYWLVETKAPTYEENGTQKKYNLLRKPVDVTVNAGTYAESAAIQVVNKKGFELPATGGVGTIIISGIGIAIIALGVVVFKGKKEDK